MEDWLNDPLMIYERAIGNLTYRKLKGLDDVKAGNWQTFHHSTRTKLEGAVHFCSLLLGVAQVNHDLGLDNMIYGQRRWYVDAFFFELCSAYDTLLQEINIIYQCGVNVRTVNFWKAIEHKLPKELATLMGDVRETDWFKKIRWYRNTTTHHTIIPMGEQGGAWSKNESEVKAWDMKLMRVLIFYIDEQTNKRMQEDITKCKEYLTKLLQHINEVWCEVASKKAMSIP